MQCEEVREQFTDYVIGQIEEPVRSSFAQHLSVCQNCRAEANEMKTLWAALDTIPAAEPSPDLRSRFHIMLEAYRHGQEQAPAPTGWTRVNSWLSGWWPRQPILQLGACAALLLLAVIVSRQVQPLPTPTPPPNNEVTELRNEVSQMRQLVAVSLMQQQ